MKPVLYGAFLLTLVPMQATVLHHLSLGGVRPDLVLVSVCLIGFLRGELQGFLSGLLLGFAQDLLSAGDLWLNLVAKSGVGLLSGLVGHQVAHVTTGVVLAGLFIISCCSGLLFLLLTQTGDWAGAALAVRSVLLPQAVFDALVGAGAYWALEERVRNRWALAE
ncbi:MAG TPA: hypothetical protein VNK46_03215 [Nitrospiraceae bacterium]|jgi:rod shape-determining protein MreD|nr:hypothetical protein [Nitrospiraceae bacterium]